MNHYTKIVDYELAKKLKEAGYPQQYGDKWYCKDGELSDLPFRNPMAAAPTYAEILDWLMEKGIYVSVSALVHHDKLYFIGGFMTMEFDMSFGYRNTFEEAIIPAIEKALDILKEIENESN